VLLHGGHAATNLVWSAVDRQEWHYSSPLLTALVLKLVWLLHLDRVDDGGCEGDADEKTCPCNTGDVVAHRQIRIDPYSKTAGNVGWLDDSVVDCYSLALLW